MAGSLPESGIPAGWRHIALGDVASTNGEAMDRALAGDPGGVWITAGRQLQGRGRRGRTWVSEPGNLYASLLLIDPAPMERLGTLPLVAALAVYNALKPLFARTPLALSIKWPNDILIDGAKVNGILLESTSLPGGRTAVIIGCGINCAHHPDNPLYPATDLKTCGHDVTPEAFLPVLATSFERELARWNRGEGFSVIREDWLRAAKGIGQPIRINLADGVLEGVFADLDARGYLMCQESSGSLRAISAGDLFFPS